MTSSLPSGKNRPPGEMYRARVHPFANALNRQNVAHKMMCRRPKNIFLGIFWATESVPLVQIRSVSSRFGGTPQEAARISRWLARVWHVIGGT